MKPAEIEEGKCRRSKLQRIMIAVLRDFIMSETKSTNPERNVGSVYMTYHKPYTQFMALKPFRDEVARLYSEQGKKTKEGNDGKEGNGRLASQFRASFHTSLRNLVRDRVLCEGERDQGT